MESYCIYNSRPETVWDTLGVTPSHFGDKSYMKLVLKEYLLDL